MREISWKGFSPVSANSRGFERLMAYFFSGLFGFLASRAAIFGAFSPFGVSVTAALSFPFVIPAFMGAAAGYIFFPAIGGFRYLASMIAVLAIRWTLNDIKKISRHPFYSAFVSLLPTLATGIAMLSAGGFTPRLCSLYIAESFIAGAASYFISRTIIIINGTKSLGMLMPQELAGLVLTGCIIILSLAQMKLGVLSVGRILAVLIILPAARYGGISGGAVAGIATGIVLGLAGAEYSPIGAAFAFGGLMAGLFAPVGKLSGVLSFLLGAGIAAVQGISSAEMLEMVYESALAGAVFLLVPDKAVSFLRAIFINGNRDENAEGLRRSIIMRLDFASKALSNVSQDVEEVSEKLTKIVTPTIDSVYQEAVDNTCSRCGMRVFCWEHRDGVSMGSFESATEKLRNDGEITMEDLGEDLKRKCCRIGEIANAVNRSYRNYLASEAAEKRIEEVRQVVAGQFCGLGDILAEMAEEYTDYEIFDNDLSDRITVRLKELGLKPSAVSCRIDYLGRMTIEAECVEADKNKLKKALLVHELSRLCGRRFDSPSITAAYGSCRITLCERPCLDIETASSQHICAQGRLCGDHLRYFTDGTGKMTALISDGMGTGGRAAVDGGMAAGIMEKLIKAGLGYDCALKVVNSALLVKSGDESLATLDVVSVDLYNGRTDFMKAGAAISFIRKGGEMYRVESPSLPAGILPQVEFSYTEDDLSDGDIIVMVSDGAVATGEDWIERIISNWEDQSMEQLSQTITDGAVSRRKDGHDDDITVIAMQIRNAA